MLKLGSNQEGITTHFQPPPPLVMISTFMHGRFLSIKKQFGTKVLHSIDRSLQLFFNQMFSKDEDDDDDDPLD
jgi:hypothetical protein